MKSIAYVTPFYGPCYPGISASVDAMMDTWRGMGVASEVVTWPATGGRVQSPAGINFLRDTFGAPMVVSSVRRRGFDAVIIRDYMPLPGIATLARCCPVFVEHHGARESGRLQLARSRGYYALARGHFFITQQLADSVNVAPAIVIGNASGLSPVSVPNNKKPVVQYSIGQIGRHHGIDLLGAIAEDIDDVGTLEVVAPASLVPHLKYQLGGAVEVVGTRDRDEYVRALGRADLALGTIALARSGHNSAETLKVRDAVASGVPVLIPYHDPPLADVEHVTVRCTPNLDGDPSAIAAAIRGMLPEAVGARVPKEIRNLVSLRGRERRRLDFIASRLPS